MSAGTGSVRFVLGGALLGAVLVVAAALVSWGTTTAQFTDTARVTTVRVTVDDSTGQDVTELSQVRPHVDASVPPVALRARGNSGLGKVHGDGNAKLFVVTPFGRAIHVE